MVFYGHTRPLCHPGVSAVGVVPEPYPATFWLKHALASQPLRVGEAERWLLPASLS
jgi:hypothetical protein